MARLVPIDPTEIAFGGRADFTVELGGSPSVELWERVLPCAPGSAPPPYALTGVFTADKALSRPVPLGDVYQVRMFRENQGNSTGAGELLGKLDRTSVNLSLTRLLCLDDSFPPDDDDPAASPVTGFVPLQFPVGEGTEDVSNRRITGRSKPLSASNSIEFDADLVYPEEYL
jgi:hypothetical protein